MDTRVRSKVTAKAFTIVDLLVAIAIIGLVAALIVPVLARSKDSAKRLTCTQQLRQFGMALAIYEESYQALSLTYPSPDSLVKAGLISDPRILLCPMDTFGGYASRFDACRGAPHAFPVSYETLHRFTAEHTFVRELERADPNHGVAACRLHANRAESYERGLRDFCLSAWTMFEGTVLRLRKDGSVQHAKFSLRRSSTPYVEVGFSLWSLFTDEPNPFRPRGSG